MVRLRRYEYEGHESLLASVGNAMILPSRRQSDLAGNQLALFIADGKHAASFEHVVNFIFVGMGMRALTLSRFETVGVAKKVIGFEDAIFFHLFR